MKRLFLIFVVLFPFASSAQKNLSVEQAKEDVAFLYKRMLQVHPGLYAYQDSSHYAEIYQSIYNSFDSEVEYLTFFKRIAPLITEIQDLHTSYRHSKKWSKTHQQVLPFVLQEVEGRFLIQYNGSSDSTLQRGLTLKEINGKPVEEVIDEVKGYLGTDNNNDLAKGLYASRSLYAYYGKLHPLKDSVTVVVKNDTLNELETHKLATLTRKELIPTVLQRYPDKARVNLNYSVIDSTRAVSEIDISSFSYKGGPLDVFQGKFTRKLRQSFKKVAKDSVQHLVLDLRQNGGGYIPNVKKILKYVSKEPFAMIDTMAFRQSAYFRLFPVQAILPPLMAPIYFNKTEDGYRYHASERRKKPKENKWHYDGPLYVYMDANSYSATVFTIALLKDMDRATFLGTIPAGTTWGSYAGSFHLPKLPNSKIQLRIPFYKVVHGLQKRPQKLFLEPDIKVDISKEQFQKDIDPFEEALLNLIKNQGQ
ncbi:S41 family peptidase [Jiulongibacter sediminis]|uniref:Tail specific protease domain-containing protein n=1 Tax=Jiulongibacter sediminis TaxID=1605367 RepID=A0A0P7BQ72_9BACT|nr:S41 family peptidase [Jiulongibacter sediminis]KPM49285.1 hypothetical protein AFM12_01265 [Jiulongibacter sediminis]TBX26338.1 hypothetical protein TK44_01265 [Jiulongibacter sediminis]